MWASKENDEAAEGHTSAPTQRFPLGRGRTCTADSLPGHAPCARQVRPRTDCGPGADPLQRCGGSAAREPAPSPVAAVHRSAVAASRLAAARPRAGRLGRPGRPGRRPAAPTAAGSWGAAREPYTPSDTAGILSISVSAGPGESASLRDGGGSGDPLGLETEWGGPQEVGGRLRART